MAAEIAAAPAGHVGGTYVLTEPIHGRDAHAAAPQLAELITGRDSTDNTERLRRRAFVVAAAQRLAAAP